MKSLTVAAFVAGALLLTGCGASDSTRSADNGSGSASTSSAEPKPSMKDKPDTEEAQSPGSYITYDEFDADRASYADGDVVLFFHASWCPKCQETDANLNASGIPEGLTVVKVDYDSANDLRQQYGVTLQHTFVQVDAGGEQLAKWNGSVDAEDIVGQTV